jgi:hypothetical protein
MTNEKKTEKQDHSDAGDHNPKAQSPKAKKELSVVSLPHDNDVIADEMAELFEEDQVTHRHGSAEPEGD